jgi:hypothetical protein
VLIAALLTLVLMDPGVGGPSTPPAAADGSAVQLLPDGRGDASVAQYGPGRHGAARLLGRGDGRRGAR